MTDESSNRDGSDEKDYRKNHPRFSGEALEKNLELINHLDALATTKGVTIAQLALAWVLSRRADVVSIPGTKLGRWLRENIAAGSLHLINWDVAALERAVARDAVVGDRYHASGMKTFNG